jgi:catechol 2,3-dioxygenase-like lactoylglutathione lyase family enzyme
MKIHFKRIDHVQITIPKGSEDEVRKFYSGLLGLEETEKPDSLKASGGVWFKIAGAELHLGVESPSPALPKGEEKPSKRHPAFEIENLDVVKKYLAENNVKIKEEIPIPGRKRFSFYDPFGNRIELLEYLY